MASAREFFFEKIADFENTIRGAVHVSEGRLGINHTGRQNRVLVTFGKTIAHAMSIQLISHNAISMRPEIGLLDHFSIGTLTRAMIESAIMTLYLSELTLSKSEWDLRRHIIFMHDLTNRKRYLSALYKNTNQKPPANDKVEYEETKSQILKTIQFRAEELGFPEDRVKQFIHGQIVFIDGLRGAIREAGLDVGHFDFIHTCLSNHVHGHPGSYLRADQHKISFETPSDFQLGFCALCLEAGAQYLEVTTDRVQRFTGHESRDPKGHLD